MRPNPVVIVDIIGSIVANANTAIIAQLQAYDPTIEAINYMYGPPLEIYETLAQMSQSQQAKKYPLVALYQPFDELKGKEAGIDNRANLRIIIARWSNATDKAPDRYSKNLKPVLYPVYAELLYQIGVDRRIAVTTWQLAQHRKKDWPYWDNDGKNPVVDCLDIIEISNLELNFRYNNCV